jgi:uncharacterized protein
MNQELISVKFDKVLQSKTYTSLVLSTGTKKFAIYTDPFGGKTLQFLLTNMKKARPSTHEFLNMMFQGFEIKVRQVIINDLQDTIYFCRVFLEQKRGDLLHIVEIDARPSDGITLALLHKAPIFCTLEVLDKVVPVID